MGTKKGEIARLRKRFGGERRWYEDEVEQHELNLPAFYIARYPTTVAQFQAFVDAKGYAVERYWAEARAAGFWREGQTKRRSLRLEGEKVEQVEEWSDRPERYGGVFDLPNHPQVGLSWYEALAYGRWLTDALRQDERTPEPLRTLLRERDWAVMLPSEAQWEKAARSTDGRLFPWGDDPDPNRANYADTQIGATSAVGCFPGGASPCGALDMAGNVWQWTRSLYQGYPYDPTDGRESLDGSGPRVVRGGSFGNRGSGVRCAYRFRYDPDYWYWSFGFRVVVCPGPL